MEYRKTIGLHMHSDAHCHAKGVGLAINIKKS